MLQQVPSENNFPVLSILDDLLRDSGSEAEESRIVEKTVINVDKWIRDEYYVGEIAVDLYNFWRDVVIEFEEEEKNELIITGGIGTGKSYCALAIFLRKLYVLSCYKPVAKYLDLASSSLVLFVYLALSVRQANLTGYGKLLRLVDSIPYFRTEFSRNSQINSIIDFKKEVAIIPGSDISHYRGGDLFGLIFDEGNFRKGTDKTKLDKALEIYNESTNRRRSRFLGGHQDKSFSIIVSSTDNMLSFTEERIKAAVNDPSVMVVRATTWQTKPRKYSGKKFWVFKGSEMVEPFLFEDSYALSSYFSYMKMDVCEIEDLQPSLQSEWIQVPEEYLPQFRSDIVRALADIAGVATGKTDRIMTNEEAFRLCFPLDGGLKHPFTRDRFVISYQSPERVEDFLLDNFHFDPRKHYNIHIDQSLSVDSTGLAISHKDVDKDGEFVQVDLMLKIDPPGKPDQISVRKVREFIIYLRDKRKLNIQLLTYDQFSSAEAIQEANNMKIKAERLSVDKDSSQYDLLVDLILRGKIRGYHYAPFKEELFYLEKDRIKRKVDHVFGRAKDVSDAVCGSVWSSWVNGKKPFSWAKFVGNV